MNRSSAVMCHAHRRSHHAIRGKPSIGLMESAATKNERAGLVSHRAVTNLAKNEGVTLSEETNEGGNRVITETLGGQVVGQFVEADAPKETMIGDALGSAVDEGVPASVQAPKVKATEDYDFIRNQGVAAQSADASLNPRLSGSQDRNTQSYVSTDKRVTHENPDIIAYLVAWEHPQG